MSLFTLASCSFRKMVSVVQNIAVVCALMVALSGQGKCINLDVALQIRNSMVFKMLSHTSPYPHRISNTKDSRLNITSLVRLL